MTVYAVNKKTKEHRVYKYGDNSYGEWGLWDFVKADTDGWIEWQGGNMPLPRDQRVQCKIVGGKFTTRLSCEMPWSSCSPVYRVTAYCPILTDHEWYKSATEYGIEEATGDTQKTASRRSVQLQKSISAENEVDTMNNIHILKGGDRVTLKVVNPEGMWPGYTMFSKNELVVTYYDKDLQTFFTEDGIGFLFRWIVEGHLEVVNYYTSNSNGTGSKYRKSNFEECSKQASLERQLKQLSELENTIKRHDNKQNKRRLERKKLLDKINEDMPSGIEVTTKETKNPF